MTTVHVLTQGFVTPNGSAVLWPILYYRETLRSLGLTCRIFRRVSPALTDCDVLLVESKFYRGEWPGNLGPILEQLNGFRERSGRLVWFDTTDSTSVLQAEVLPIVDRYCKAQLLKDRSQYRKAYYGIRIYTDYYNKTLGITDAKPEFSTPIGVADHLAKLTVSWNSSLSNYSKWALLLVRGYRRLPIRRFLRPPGRWVAPSSDRPVKVSARFGASYAKATVRFQRERVRELLRSVADTSRLPRGPYLKEMERSRVVVAPFGWGELTYRDYEAFISGSLVVKPDMSHLETWPDLYRDGVTILTHRWDMSDLIELLDRVSRDYRQYLPIAAAGQLAYQQSLLGKLAAESFAKRFAAIVRDP